MDLGELGVIHQIIVDEESSQMSNIGLNSSGSRPLDYKNVQKLSLNNKLIDIGVVYR